MKKILILIIFFYILVLFQTSFLVHFNILGIIPNFVLIFVILINFFHPQTNFGLVAAFISGFFLDIFSENFFGFWTLTLLVLAAFIKFILRRQIHFPIFKYG